MDGNINALNRYLEEQDKQSLALEQLEDYINDELKIIMEVSERIVKIADGFEGYDFTDEAKEMIKEFANV